MSSFVARRRRFSPGWIVFAAAVVIVLTGVLLLGPFRVSARAERSSPTPTSRTASEMRPELTVQPPTRTCSVAGDLVGDANPSEVAMALCGDR